MNKIFVILMVSFLSSIGVFTLTEDEAIARIDRVVFFALYSINNPTNTLFNNTCCGVVNADKTCKPCIYRVQVRRIDNLGIEDRFTAYLSPTAGSYYNGFVTTGHNADTKIHKSYHLVHIVDGHDFLYDKWGSMSSTVVGTYPMNGVYGEYYKSLVYGAFNINPPLPNMPYYSMIFTIRNIEWISPSSICPKATPFEISAFVESVSVWTSQIHNYDGTVCAYPVKYTGGTDNPIILKENTVLTLNVVEAKGAKATIDSLVIRNINTNDRQRTLEFVGVLGASGKIRMDIDVTYNCKGYVGKNCVFTCQPIDVITECKPEDGSRYCKNGADDLKSCSTFTNTCHASPCANGAPCTAYRTGYFCNCTEGWAGRDCRDSVCRQLCYRGVCGDSNSCSCNSGYSGRWCDKSSCTETDRIPCQNGGTCIKIRDVPSCNCPPVSSGNDCSTLLCNPVCKMGKCEVTPNSNPVSVQCTCVAGYNGIACENLISAPSIFVPRDYIYAISGLCIIFALLVKIMIVYFLIPSLFKQDKPEETRTVNITPQDGAAVA